MSVAPEVGAPGRRRAVLPLTAPDGGPSGASRREAAAQLEGRAEELGAIRAFLGAAATRGAVLLVSGDAGVGKTALLDAAAALAAADGALVLRAEGVEFEVDLAFSGLNQIVLPLGAELAALGPGHRMALSTAVGLVDGPPVDRAAVLDAALALLREAASARPVLVIADDLQWLDRSSAGTLSALARQVAGTRVGILAASRPGTTGYFERTGLPRLDLAPLDDAAAARLLAGRFPALGPRVHRGVLGEAQGNALALLELPVGLGGRERDLPAVLPLNRRLQGVFADRIDTLPRAARRSLLLAALEGTGDLGVLARCPSWSGTDELRAAMLATPVPDDRGVLRLAFRHPLVRSTVVALSTGTERREAHAALAAAAADRPGRRAWHLAEAAPAPDELVAGLLEEAARGALRRGDSVGAVALMLRSAELSPHRPDRGRRLAEAAYVGADVNGDLRTVPHLLDDADHHGSLQAAAATAFLLLNSDGDVDTAHRLLVDALDAADPAGVDGDALHDALHTLLMVCSFGGRAELWRPFHDVIARLGPRVPPVLTLCAWSLGDAARTPPAAVEQVEAAVAGLRHQTDPTLIVRTAVAAFHIDRLAGCRDALGRVAEDGRRGGALGSAVNAVSMLSFDALHAGRWDEAAQLAQEHLEICAAHGYRLLTGPGQLCLGLLAAARGDDATVRRVTDDMSAWAVPRKARKVENYVHNVLALAAAGRGDAEDAYRHAAAVSPPGVLGPDNSHALWLMWDLVDAAVRTDRGAEAAAHVAAMQRVGVAALSPRFALIVAGATALAAPAHGAGPLFEAALGLPDIDRWPFDLARVRLAHGEHLRRSRSAVRARGHLGAALAAFERLGAAPWAARAAAELHAAERGPGRRAVRGPAALTHQERRVATLAAGGSSNKQIAESVRISHRTVGSHLQKAYWKLGISSRAALRDALGR